VGAALVVAAVTGALWWRSERAKAAAEQEGRRAEASKLVALGRLDAEADPTSALAFARKSLAVHDNAEARRLVLEALWRGPIARVMPLPAKEAATA
jgi:hypothetical protein